MMQEKKVKKIIFIIEDEDAIISPLKLLLERDGYEITFARDGEEALRTLEGALPDLILLDLILPKIDGFQVLEKIKTDDSTKHIPVVIISNLGDERDVRRGLDLGAIRYFIKSQFSVKEIADYIKTIL